MYQLSSTTYLNNGIKLFTYAGKNLIIISPSPVATAPPTPFIAYAPAPMMGESPTLLKKKLIEPC